MTVPTQKDDDGLSLMALGTALLRHRRRISRYMILAGLLAAMSVAFKPKQYAASASFVPQGADPSRSGLASLAGQFGISVPTANAAQSPDFYLRILKSRVILQQIAADTLLVLEKGNRRIAFVDLFRIREGPSTRRQELARGVLLKLVETSAVKTTGVVELSVKTEWPSVSLAIATALVNGVNEFNQRTRQLQASAERRFVEGRLAVASADQRAVEDRLEELLKTNREFSSSPQLVFRRDRLQRELELKRLVTTSLAQSMEEVRIREVRDTPVITVLEPAAVSTLPEPRRRVLITLLGVLFGGLLGVMIVFVSEIMARLRHEGDMAAEELLRTLREVREDLWSPVLWLRQRFQ